MGKQEAKRQRGEVTQSPSNSVTQLRFLVTEECGRLARWLRLLGYDTVLVTTQPRTELYRTAYRDQRIVVTRNRTIGASCLFRVVQLASPHLEPQLRQLREELRLSIDEDRRLTRCDVCNVPVEPIENARVKDHVPPHVYHTQARFWTCPSCRRIYWAATHYQRVCTMLKRLNA